MCIHHRTLRILHPLLQTHLSNSTFTKTALYAEVTAPTKIRHLLQVFFEPHTKIIAFIHFSQKVQSTIDPIQSSLFKNFATLLVLTTVNISSLSTSKSTHPMHFKNSVVKPLFSKPSSNKEIRPISNLSFL